MSALGSAANHSLVICVGCTVLAVQGTRGCVLKISSPKDGKAGPQERLSGNA